MNAVPLSMAQSLTDEPTRATRDAEQLSEVKAARRELRGRGGVLARLLDR